MKNFTEWLSQINKNTFNELFEPDDYNQTVAPHEKLAPNKVNVSELFQAKIKQADINSFLLQLSDAGTAFIRNKFVPVIEKADRLGKGINDHLSMIDAKYDGVLIIGSSILFYVKTNVLGRGQNPIVNAISRFANQHNLVFLKFGKNYIVFSEAGYERLKDILGDKISEIFDVHKYTPGMNVKEIAAKQQRLASARKIIGKTKEETSVSNIPTFAELRGQTSATQ